MEVDFIVLEKINEKTSSNSYVIEKLSRFCHYVLNFSTSKSGVNT